MISATQSIDAARAGYGVLFLVLGVAVYVFARADAAAFLPAALHLPRGGVAAGAAVTGSLPAFAHTAAFALLTCAALGTSRSRVATACSFWVATNVLFEMGQHPRVSERLAASLPDWLDRVWLLDPARRLFASGTFDYFDIAAAVAGGGLAAAVSLATSRRGEQWP